MIESKLADIRMRRCGILAVLFLSAMCVLTGCIKSDKQQGEWQTMAFTVVDLRTIPEELAEIIEENKRDEIRMAYEDEEMLYLIRGYGEQKSGGYSISVLRCEENEEEMVLETQLIGPANPKEISKEPSYPVLVLAAELTEKEVRIE